jgi:hypothetical protein
MAQRFQRRRFLRNQPKLYGNDAYMIHFQTYGC